MKPNTSDTVQVSSSMNVAAEQFTVDENSLAKIMSVLTNLYSDPEGAVVREYLTNALDAQIEAQEADPNYVWRPIEVTTPSMFSKEYKVRDFGPGMNATDLKEIYSKYGKSTKEDSQSVTGMLGLGSKCALTYTGQFTIVGYKGGVCTKAVVSKDENDIPVFMVVDTRATTEPNGVEISVPVRDRNSFAQKTGEFLRWWKEGQVLVDGSEPEKHGLTLVKDEVISYSAAGSEHKGRLEVYLRNAERYSYRSEAPQSYVVMGNVPYAVDSEYVEAGLRDAGLGFVAYVPMGMVDFPPSREKLFYNNRTKKAISQISAGLFEKILDEKLKEITDAPDHATAWGRHGRLDHHFSSHPKAKGLKYKGLDFTDRHQHNHMVLSWDWQGYGQITEKQWITLSHALQGILVVTGHPQSKPTSYFKKKVRYYMEQNSIDYANAYIVDADIDNAWMKHLPRVDAQTIKDIKLPKDGGSGPRGEAPYEYYVVDSAGDATRQSEVKIDVPKGYTLCYISPQDMKETYSKRGIQASIFAELLGPDVVLVVTGKNRFVKLLRTYPDAVKAEKVVKEKAHALVASVTDAEYLFSQLAYGEKEFFSKVTIADIKDPELQAIAKVVQGKGRVDNYSKAEHIQAMAKRASIWFDLPQRKTIANMVTKRYPLIENMGNRHMKHLMIYVNAVWEQEYATQP